jgi:hypothetical protein
MLNYARVAKNDRVGGYVGVYVTVGSDKDIVTNGDVADYSSVNAYPDLVTYCRGTSAKPSVRLPDDDSLVDVAIPANAGVGINGDIIVMAYI